MTTFAEIDRRRAAHSISQNALCRAANVHPITYSRRKHDGTAERGNTRTLGKLERALARLIAAKQAAVTEAAE